MLRTIARSVEGGFFSIQREEEKKQREQGEREGGDGDGKRETPPTISLMDHEIEVKKLLEWIHRNRRPAVKTEENEHDPDSPRTRLRRRIHKRNVDERTHEGETVG